jgi:chromosome segregation ATPase
MPKNEAHKTAEARLEKLSKQITDSKAAMTSLLEEDRLLAREFNRLGEELKALEAQYDTSFDEDKKILGDALSVIREQSTEMKGKISGLEMKLQAIEPVKTNIETALRTQEEIRSKAGALMETQMLINDLEEDVIRLRKEQKELQSIVKIEEGRFALLRDDDKIKTLQQKITDIQRKIDISERGGVNIMTAKSIAEMKQEVQAFPLEAARLHAAYEKSIDFLKQHSTLKLSAIEDANELKKALGELLTTVSVLKQELKQTRSSLDENQGKKIYLESALSKFAEVNYDVMDKQDELREKQQSVKEARMKLEKAIVMSTQQLQVQTEEYDRAMTAAKKTAKPDKPLKAFLNKGMGIFLKPSEKEPSDKKKTSVKKENNQPKQFKQ